MISPRVHRRLRPWLIDAGSVASVVLLAACPATQDSSDGSATVADTGGSSDGGVSSDDAGSSDDSTGGGAVDSSSGDVGSSGASSSDGSDGESGTTGQGEAGSIIYVHFDGITLTDGEDDPVNDTSELFPGTYGAYSGSEGDRAALIEAMQVHWAPFDVAVTDVRPADGPYVMAVIAPPGTFPPGGGVSPLDCNDFNPTSIVFAFEPGAPERIARVASGRVGVSMGVSNSSHTADLSGSDADPDASWLDMCIPLDEPTVCVQQAFDFCDSASEQNTFQIVLSVLGPAT